MGSTNFTEHYEIPLPLGSDKTSPMDYNTSMQVVDTELFTTASTASTASSTASDAAAAVANLANNVIGGNNGIDARLTSVEGTVATQGTAITNLGNKVDAVKADALDMICAYDEGEAQVGKTSTHAYSVGDYFRYNDVLYRVTAQISIGDTIIPNTNCEATNVTTELQGEVDKIGDLTALETTTKTDCVTAINEVKSDLNKIGNVYSDISSFDESTASWYAGDNGVTLPKGNYILSLLFQGGTGNAFSLFGYGTSNGQFTQIPADGSGNPINATECTFVLPVSQQTIVKPYVYGSGACSVYITAIRIS